MFDHQLANSCLTIAIIFGTTIFHLKGTKKNYEEKVYCVTFKGVIFYKHVTNLKDLSVTHLSENYSGDLKVLNEDQVLIFSTRKIGM